MAFIAEGDEAGPASHLQGGIVVNIVERRVARLDNIRHRIYTRQGFFPWPVKQECSCQSGPCGFRAYPGVYSLRNLSASDFLKLLQRAGWSAKDIDNFAAFIDGMAKRNERLRREGGLRKMDFMYLGRVPGPLVRGLCHDFPAEFATSDGVTVDAQHKRLEQVLTEFFANRCYRPAGVGA